MKKATIALLLVCTAVFAQEKGTFTDSRDKKKYKTVKIGEQTWMAENLNYNAKGSVCYEDKPENCNKYGRLYNQVYNKDYTAQEFCPTGWRLPNDEDWLKLAEHIGEEPALKLKAADSWDKLCGAENCNGKDDLGFTALAGGYRETWNAELRRDATMGDHGYWWTTESAARMASYYNQIRFGYRNIRDAYAFSVRCLKDVRTNAEKKLAKAKADSIAKVKATAVAKWKADSLKARADSIKAEAAEKAAVEGAIGKQFNPNIKYGSMADSRDKKTYKTVNIDGFTWMAENLNYDEKGSECPKNYYCKRDGRKYNWEMANKACPTGWHLPNDNEWLILIQAAGGTPVAGKKLKAANIDNWNGTDDYGFSAIPEAIWWTSTVYDTVSAKYVNIYPNGDNAFRSTKSKEVMYYVRCVQGKSPEETIETAEKAAVENAIGKQFNPKINYGSMTDPRDKKTYKTTKIGQQTWMAENLNYEAKGSKCYKDKDFYCKRDGRIYDWATAKTACPAGWHLPIDGEWKILENAVGGEKVARTKLIATSGWFSEFSEYTEKKPLNGTDDFGFSALPAGSGGWVGPKDGFSGAAVESNWWSASERAGSGYYSNISNRNGDRYDKINTSINTKTILFNVRCLQGEVPKEDPASAATPAKPPAAAPAAPAKTMYCVSYVVNKAVSCLELKDTPADKKTCDSQGKGMKMMMGQAKWTDTKPSIKCDKN